MFPLVRGPSAKPDCPERVGLLRIFPFFSWCLFCKELPLLGCSLSSVILRVGGGQRKHDRKCPSPVQKWGEKLTLTLGIVFKNPSSQKEDER